MPRRQGSRMDGREAFLKKLRRYPVDRALSRVGEGRKAMEFSRALFDNGVMATGIAFPTVPEGKARIRLIMTSEHTRAQLDQALDKLQHVARQLGILQ